MSGGFLTTTPRSSDHGNPRASGWRMWVPVVVVMTASCLSYIDRQALTVIAPMILRDTHLSATSYGDAISVFSIAYMVANPLWGSLIDYIGLRLGMLLAVGVWTLASASHAWVVVLPGFAVAQRTL